MTAAELAEKLEKLTDGGTGDSEADHSEADKLLLEFIDDKRVTDAFDRIEKWYA